MIGGRRYLKDDIVPVYDYDHTFQLKKWDEVFTDDPLLLNAVNAPTGYGGINWALIGYVMMDFADDIPGMVLSGVDTLLDAVSSIVSSDARQALSELLAPSHYAGVPLFGAEEWSPDLFPTGSLNLDAQSRLLLGIALAGYLIKKLPGLAIGFSALAKTALARAKVSKRHDEIVSALESLQSQLQTAGQVPQSKHAFKLFDDMLDEKALKALSMALVNDQKGPINSFAKKYPHWGLEPTD